MNMTEKDWMFYKVGRGRFRFGFSPKEERIWKGSSTSEKTKEKNGRTGVGSKSRSKIGEGLYNKYEGWGLLIL